jgi:hypothetical protein
MVVVLKVGVAMKEVEVASRSVHTRGEVEVAWVEGRGSSGEVEGGRGAVKWVLLVFQGGGEERK